MDFAPDQCAQVSIEEALDYNLQVLHELPLFIGTDQDPPGTWIFSASPDGIWSLLFIGEDKKVCVVAGGSGWVAGMPKKTPGVDL